MLILRLIYHRTAYWWYAPIFYGDAAGPHGLHALKRLLHHGNNYNSILTTWRPYS